MITSIRLKNLLIILTTFMLFISSTVFIIIYYIQLGQERKEIINIQHIYIEPSPSNTVEEMIDNPFHILQQKNADLVGWIKIDSTNINYPVVQTINNNYYLTTSFEKKKSKLRFYIHGL